MPVKSFANAIVQCHLMKIVLILAVPYSAVYKLSNSHILHTSDSSWYSLLYAVQAL